MIKNVTIGTDPELFLMNEQGLVSAENKFGGTKSEPRPLPREGFFIQEDNVMVEFNIPPAKKVQDLKDSIEYMLDYIQVGAQQFDCNINKLSSGRFDKKELATEQAQTFGCEPDFNAYTEEPNGDIICDDPLFRTCGGHIHIGYDNPMDMQSIKLVKALDLTLGLPSLLIDKDKERRKLYGSAGSYRLKSFGVEYRTLSNFWIFDQKHIDWVWEGVYAAIDLINSGAYDQMKNSILFKRIPEVINSNNKEEAFNLIQIISKTLKKQTICVD